MFENTRNRYEVQRCLLAPPGCVIHLLANVKDTSYDVQHLTEFSIHKDQP